MNKAEKEYLEALGVEAYIKVRTMAINFNKLKLISEREKGRLRRELKIPENSIVLTSYVGVFREEFSSIKGAHPIVKAWKILRSNTKKLLAMIITGLRASWCNKLRSIGIRSYEFLPHGHYLDLVKALDVYFLLATIRYYYDGPGVSVMGALALGKPIVSPTLIHFPERNKIKDIGAITPFVYNETLF